MHCVLIYNPAAGRRRRQGEALACRVAESLRSEGHTAEVMATSGPGTAAGLARGSAGSADVVFACGGDGTVHEVLQGLVREGYEPAAALGVVPLGSANALARHLHLPLDPVRAALEQVRGRPCAFPVGKARHEGGVRYFLVMAGAGPDGALAHSLSSWHKSQLGRSAYYLYSARLLLTRWFHPCTVEWLPSFAGAPSRRRAVSAMAVRVGNLGGLFSGLTDRKASIYDPALKLYILSPPALLSLPLWFVTGWLRIPRLNPFFHCVEARWFACKPVGHSILYAQVDGEELGPLPFEVSLIPDAVRILLPTK